MAAHRATRQGDEMYCPVCGTRWAIDEEAPEKCVSTVFRNSPPPSAPRVKRATPQQWQQLSTWVRNGFKDGEKPDGI